MFHRFFHLKMTKWKTGRDAGKKMKEIKKKKRNKNKKHAKLQQTEKKIYKKREKRGKFDLKQWSSGLFYDQVLPAAAIWSTSLESGPFIMMQKMRRKEKRENGEKEKQRKSLHLSLGLFNLSESRMESVAKVNDYRRYRRLLSEESIARNHFPLPNPPPPPIRHSLHLQPPFFHFQSETRSIIVVWFVSYSSGRAHWLGRVYRCWFMMVRNIPGWRVDSSGRLCV